MKNKLLKQVIGIDVAQKELVVSIGNMDQEALVRIYAHKIFANNERGFVAMILWVKKQTDADQPLRYVMEATDVYHEAVACFLSEKNLFCKYSDA